MPNRRHLHPPRRAFSLGRALRTIAVLASCALGTDVLQGQATPAPVSAEWAALDSILQASYPADGPGATAIVVYNGEVVYRGAAGMASLELGVPMRPEMVFPLFSITKQFTNVAILMLAQEGRLSLSDPITRFFPDYPGDDRTITVENLMGHTSGLANYSDLERWGPMLRNHVSAGELIGLFRGEPFRFDPGTQWEYNNSGYVLLGQIIERVSGLRYGDFLRTRIFAPLGMTSTFVYDAPDAVIPGRVAGYSRDASGWTDAAYFSLTHGYAVGNLLSSVDDLARWEAAIERGELLSADGWARAFTSFRLNDGTETRYAAGWFLGSLGPLATAEHGGDLIGGMTQVLRIPEKHLFVAVLANADPAATDPERLSLVLAARVLGISPDPAEVSRTAAQLDEYVGTYRVDEGATRAITREEDRLYSQRSGGDRLELYPVGDDLFAVRSSPGTQMHFARENGRVASMTVRPRLGLPSAPAPKIDAP